MPQTGGHRTAASGSVEAVQGRVLLVEEANGERRGRLARACERAGLDVVRTVPEEAGPRLAEVTFDVVVVPAELALVARVFREVAGRPDGPALLAIFERGTRGADMRARELGADGWIVRPASSSAVAAAAVGFARARRLARSLAARERELAEARTESGPVDPFTGFHRFEAFKPWLASEVKRARRYHYPLSVLLLAFDDLEEVRRVQGPEAAHGLYGALARSLSAGLRDLDIPVAFEEEQVMVVLPHTPRKGARAVAERLRRQARRARLELDAAPLGSTVSIGLAAHDGKGEVSFADLAREAAEALEIAVRAGGNRVAVVPVTRRRVVG